MTSYISTIITCTVTYDCHSHDFVSVYCYSKTSADICLSGLVKVAKTKRDQFEEQSGGVLNGKLLRACAALQFSEKSICMCGLVQ